MFEETLLIVKNPDHLSKIIEEDCRTQYGWSKIAASNEPKKLFFLFFKFSQLNQTILEYLQLVELVKHHL